MANVLSGFVNVFWFALLLGVLIFVHELGHFTFAKLFDVKVLRFSLGFGPRLIGVRKGDTDYCVSALPLGGYVKMVGELNDSEIAPEDRPRAFSQKPVWMRSIILVFGPVANLVLALLVYVVMFTGKQTFGDTRIGVVTPAGPAWQAGLRPGDRIVAIGERPVNDWSDILTGIGEHPGAHLTMTYERAGQRQTVAVQPEAHVEHDELQEDQKRGRIGISLFYVKPILAVVESHEPRGQGRSAVGRRHRRGQRPQDRGVARGQRVGRRHRGTRGRRAHGQAWPRGAQSLARARSPQARAGWHSI